MFSEYPIGRVWLVK